MTKKNIKTNLTHCLSCDYLFLSNTDWLEIAYKDEFYGDTGYVSRNINMVNKTLILFRIWKLLSRQRFPAACDFGAGIGLYARLMRDNGYNFFGSDEYSEMQLIKPFINKKSIYPIKTAFEVVEHLPSFPLFLKKQIKIVDLFLFTTELRETGTIPDNDWWYYCFPNGQHIGFHSKKSLKKAFAISGYNQNDLISYGKSIHALTNNRNWILSFKLSRFLWKISSFFESIKKGILSKIFSEKSKQIRDHDYAMDLLKNKTKKVSID